MANKLPKLSRFLGINRRLDRGDLITEEGVFVASAANVELTPSGNFVGRQGYARIAQGQDMHSLWAAADGRAFVASQHKLCRLDVKSGDVVPLDLEIGKAALLAFADLPDGDIAVADGKSLSRIRPDSSIAALWQPAPSPEPNVAVHAGGDSFLYCFAYVDARGVVGLATQVRRVVGSVVEFDVPAPPAGLMTQVYVSHPNGEVMYLMAESLGGVVSVGALRLGGTCPTLHLQPMPSGAAMQVHGGRLYVVRGNAIYFSEPYSFGVMRATNFMQFPAPVTVLAAMPAGCFIVADKTYWMLGSDPATASLSSLNEHVGVERSLARLSSGRVVWDSDRGPVLGTEEGSVVALTDEVMQVQSVVRGTAGATLPVERRGAEQIISKRLQPGFGRAGVTMEAE